MSTPTVYVLCDQNCKREGMTKEQILAAITQAVESHEISDVDTGFVTTLKTVNGIALSFFVGTQEAWAQWPSDQKDGVFAIFTNDTTGDALKLDIEQLQAAVDDILDGTQSVPKSNTIQGKDGNYKTLQNALLEMVYPVGSIYMSVNSANPQTFLGGTWEAWGAGKVPVGIDTSDTDFATVEKTGGEKAHTLTENESPTHAHLEKLSSDNGANIENYIITNTRAGSANAGIMLLDSAVSYKSDTSRTSKMYTDYAGGGQAHNNLQPYITCYMWKRTA